MSGGEPRNSQLRQGQANGGVFRLPDSIFRVQPSPREELFWSGPAHKSFAIGEVAANARAHCFPLLQFGSYSAVSVGAHFGASAYINTRWRMYAVKEMEVEGYLPPLPVRCNFTLWLMWMSLDWTRDKRWNLGFLKTELVGVDKLTLSLIS